MPIPEKRPAHCVYPGGHAQVPSVQVAPPGHTVPHAPQLRLLVCKLTHPPSHSVRPVLQLPVQAPPEHSVPRGQRLPHTPQFRGSELKSVQAVPHCVSPELQAHFPSRQLAPVAQGLLHPPQLFGSVDRSTHAPLQFVSEPHDVVHEPDAHTSALGQTLPQAPQLAGSL